MTAAAPTSPARPGPRFLVVTAGLVALGVRLAMAQASSSAPPPPAGGSEPEAGFHSAQVVELLSGRPIPGALVIFAWFRNTEAVARRDLLTWVAVDTDAAGRFRLQTAPLEATLSPPFLPPRVLIFRGGYTPFPNMLDDPRTLRAWGTPASRLAELGGEVRLRPVVDAEDRSEVFNATVHMMNRADPLRAPGRLGTVLLEEIEAIGRLMIEQRGTAESGP